MNESIYNDGPVPAKQPVDRQTEILEQIRNGISIVAVELMLILLLILITLLGSSS